MPMAMLNTPKPSTSGMFEAYTDELPSDYGFCVYGNYQELCALDAFLRVASSWRSVHVIPQVATSSRQLTSTCAMKSIN
jgi:hypothetical protein